MALPPHFKKKGSLVVHLGLPKCASTFLQKDFFPYLRNSEFIYSGANLENLVEENIAANKCDPELYNLIGSPLAGSEAQRIEKIRELKTQLDTNEKIIILSAEHFIMPGNSLQMNVPGGEKRVTLDAEKIFSHLREIDQSLKLIIVIRRQWDWMSSWYQNRVIRLEVRSIRKYMRSPEFEPIAKILNYNEMVEHYVKLVGESNILVIPFERLQSNPTEFCDDLAAFIGDEFDLRSTSVRRHSLSGPMVAFSRIYNALILLFAKCFSKPMELTFSLMKKKKIIYRFDFIFRKAFGKFSVKKSEIDSKFIKQFEASNRKLDQRLNIGLKDLGYY